jgi:hemerythrin-like domain-containing protein
MLRHKNLIPLSRQHQHALALCVRINRASPIASADTHVWQREIAEHFETEIGVHFAAEEQVLFPAARRFPELSSLIEDLLSDHAWLRCRFAAAQGGRLNGPEMEAFAVRLGEHIRKEERQLFERMQKLLGESDFERIGEELERSLKEARQTCFLPRERPPSKAVE